MTAPDLQERLFTPAEFYALSLLPDYADQRLELVDGEIITMSRPGGEHGKATARFIAKLVPFVDANGLGEVGTENGYIMASGNVRGPDISFVAYATHPEGIPDQGFAPFAPDLAIEVVSPHDNAQEVQYKVLDYLNSSSQAVWLLYLHPRSLVIHTSLGSRILQPGDVLDGGEVLPGFRLPIAGLFPDLDGTSLPTDAK